MERIDYVNDHLTLIQETDGLTFGTDALLLAAFVKGKHKRGLEIGSGSGIISMLLLSRNKIERTVAVEVQEAYAELTRRNAEKNGLSDRMKTVLCDIRTYKASEEFDILYSNPPYMKTTCGKSNSNDSKNIARHEVNGDIFDFCQSAKRLLRYGGDFYCVYRPDRLSELLCALTNAEIEPKRLTMVYANPEAKPSMVLVCAKRGAASGMNTTAPFFIYRDKSNKDYSDDMNEVMENGSFPKRFT